MSTKPKLFACVFLSLLFPVTAVHADDAAKEGLRIAKLADKASRGFVGASSKMEMVLINKRGDKITRRMALKIQEAKGTDQKSLMSLEWPADVRGTLFLQWTYSSKDDDRWLYMPGLRRTKRIAAGKTSSSFMGSEFTYEDMSNVQVKKFRYKFVKEAKYNKRKVWIVEQFPKYKNSAYKRQVVWFDQQYKAPVKIEYYDRKNELIKVATYKGYKKIKRWWRPGQLIMKNLKTRKKSMLRWKNFKVEQEFSTDVFDSTNLSG